MKTRKKLIYRLLIIGIIIWSIFLIKQQINIIQYDEELKELSNKIEVAEEELEQNKQYLEEEKQNTNSLEYIERIAREKLGMYLQNERVYIDRNM